MNVLEYAGKYCIQSTLFLFICIHFVYKPQVVVL